MPANEAYIVSSVRTAVGKAPRGRLRNCRPENVGAVAVGEGGWHSVEGSDGDCGSVCKARPRLFGRRSNRSANQTSGKVVWSGVWMHPAHLILCLP